MASIPENPHALSESQIISTLETDPEQGLSPSKVRDYQEKFGKNRLEQQKSKHPLRIFLEQFLDPVIYVLVVATVLAFLFEEWIEGIAVLIVILITALIGFIMEWQAVRSMQALRKMAQTISSILRDGQVQELKAEHIVPGDILMLEMGDVIPADARVIEHENLAVKESALTGESTQVEKKPDTLSEDTSLAERHNMVFKGTLVTRGTAKAVITSTGDRTELGKISRMTQEAEKEATPLEKKLNRLSKRLIWLTLILTVIIAIAGYLQGKDLLLMIETAIALAVAAIPEGLPIVATIALARGMLRLAKKRVIIKKLQAVQTLGETGVICTDKTGTLTENKMSAQEMVFANESIADLDERATDYFKDWRDHEVFAKMIMVGALCNNVNPDAEEMHGDPVEIALVELAEQAGYSVNDIRDKHAEVLENPFDTETKMMATVNEAEDGYWICVKGALENVLECCDHVLEDGSEADAPDENYWMEQADRLAAAGLRTLSFAYRKSAEQPNEDDLYQNLTFLGVIGFIDPPRTDVQDAIAICHHAGIHVVMVTGDHPKTARKIAEEVGVLESDAADHKVMHGRDLASPEELTEEQEKHLLETVVFARVTPSQKLHLVSLYQKNNQIVGMTGDGVNDAPALKKADIGIAMGIRGTEAAKEVADVILRDDSFASIELAIRQGRVIFENIRKFVVYLLSSNLAEIISVTIASITALPLPLMPLQILYLNLVTDVFPALALGMGEGEKDIMDDPPRDADEPIMPRKLWITTAVYGLSITAGVIGITIFANRYLQLPDNQVNNMAFYTLVLAQLLNVFNLPKRNLSFFVNEVTRNPWVWGAIVLCVLLTVLGYVLSPLQQALSLVPLAWENLGWVGAFALGSLVITQIVKRLGGTI
jgi:Ca2+-transporting ATPase